MRRRDGVLVAGSATVGAVAAWWSVRNGVGMAPAVGDALVGVVLLVAAAAARLRSDSRVGLLAGVAGITWFAGSFVPELQLVHRGALVHLLLSYPTGRLPWWPARIAVAASYVAGLVAPGLLPGEAVPLSTAVLVAAVAVAGHLRRSGTPRRAGAPALVVTLLFTGTIVAGAVGRLAGWQIDRAVLWVYFVVVAAGAVLLVADLRRGQWADAVVAGLVVDLAAQPGTGTLAGHLRLALGDPSLTVGVWSTDQDGYVDDAGRVVPTDVAGADRTATFLTEDGATLAVLVHDTTVLNDPALVESVAAAARLAISNARLEAEARRRLEELTRSRRRIVAAGDVQRRELAWDLAEGAQRHLAAAAAGLRSVRERVAEADRPAVDELASELVDAAAELADLAHGIHPRVLGDSGLAAALESLRARTPVPVDILATEVRLPEAVELTVYYVCAEALANVAKHASATRVRIDINIGIAPGHRSVVLTVADDGRGGADPGRGTGLAGLNDRVMAVGGRLRLTSVPGEGTCLTATFPTETDGAATITA
jgi:signal transduction histidine kinase